MLQKKPELAIVMMQKKHELAVEYYTNAIRHKPLKPINYTKRGESYLELDHLSKAFLDFQNAAYFYKKKGEQAEYEIAQKAANSILKQFPSQC